MREPELIPIPIYLYISRAQTGFNQFSTQLLSIDEDYQVLSTDYKRFDQRSAQVFYNMMTSPENLIARTFEEIELHCRGRLRNFSSKVEHDEYFGRPKIITMREFFLRRLTGPERDYLQKQFDTFNISRKRSVEKKTKLKLVD